MKSRQASGPCAQQLQPVTGRDELFPWATGTMFSLDNYKMTSTNLQPNPKTSWS